MRDCSWRLLNAVQQLREEKNVRCRSYRRASWETNQSRGSPDSFSQLFMDSFKSFHWHLNNHLLIRWSISRLQHFFASASQKLSYRPLMSYSRVPVSKLLPRRYTQTNQQHMHVCVCVCVCVRVCVCAYQKELF